MNGFPKLRAMWTDAWKKHHVDSSGATAVCSFIHSFERPGKLKRAFFNAYIHKVVKTWPWKVLRTREYCSLLITAVIQSSCCSQSWQNNSETGNLEPTLGKMPDLVAWSPVAVRLRREKDFPVVDEANLQSCEGYQLSFVGWAAHLMRWYSLLPRNCWEWLTFSPSVEKTVCCCMPRCLCRTCDQSHIWCAGFPR